MGDFALLWADGSADLSILDDDLESDEGLRTAILLSLFTDRRADDGDQLAEGEDPRGWWGDEFLEDPNDRFGSKLWQLDRTKITPDLLPRVVDIDREALAWMVEDRVLESIDPEAELHGEHLYHAITFRRPGQDAVRWLFPHVWDGEVARASTLVLPALVPTTFAGSIDAEVVLSGGLTLEEGYSLDTLSPSDIAAITSKPAPGWFLDCGVASGAEDLVGADDLADSPTTPVKEVVDVALGGKCTDINATALRYMTAASGTPGDVGAETLTAVWIGRFTAHSITSGIFVKRASGADGFMLYTTAAGHVVAYEDGPSGGTTRTIAVNHGTVNPQTILMTREYTANNFSVYSREGSSTGTRIAQTLTNATAFRLGASYLSATLARHAKYMQWTGADGDGFSETERLAIAQSLSLEA